MATSLSTFFSFLSPSSPPPAPSPPPPTAKLPPAHYTPAQSQAQKATVGQVPLVAREARSAPLPADLSSVVCPSLAYANTLFFSGGYNVQVLVDDNEPEERLLNRFRREVMKAGVIQECKRRRFYENKQEEKKRKTREAAKRNRKRRPQSRAPSQRRQDDTSSKRDDDEEDNWELPDEDIPY